ncbi:hypothetical protein [Lacticaseibacillus daqingensis]|uniref:hypothetical protein n=1 Tax=Lacticaseibacillus daqingensis TaxID=2486014 RepID=UPI000F76C8F0|nr:hypothetical protein [Lacticaseibacillus daqingensis]
MPEALRNQIVTNLDFDKLEQLIRNRRRGGYFKEDGEQYWPGFGLKRLWQHVCQSLNCPQRIRAEVKHVIGARLNEFYNAYNDCIISDENLPSLDIRDAFQDYTPDYAQKSYLVAVQKRVAFDTSDFGTLLSYNKCIRNPGFQTFPVHLRN